MVDIEPYDIEWTFSALENDDSILKDLVFAILRLALSDFESVGDQTLLYQKSWKLNIYRDEVVGFFNSSFFGEILDAYFPHCEQEDVCNAIKANQYQFKKYNAMCGRSNIIPRKRRKRN